MGLITNILSESAPLWLILANIAIQFCEIN